MRVSNGHLAMYTGSIHRRRAHLKIEKLMRGKATLGRGDAGPNLKKTLSYGLGKGQRGGQEKTAGSQHENSNC